MMDYNGGRDLDSLIKFVEMKAKKLLKRKKMMKKKKILKKRKRKKKLQPKTNFKFDDKIIKLLMVIDSKNSTTTTPLHIFKTILYFVFPFQTSSTTTFFFFSTLFHLNFYKNSAT